MTKKSPTMQHIRLAVDEEESCSPPGANRHFPAHKRPPWITTPGWSRPTRTLGRVLDGRPCDPEERGSEEHHSHAIKIERHRSPPAPSPAASAGHQCRRRPPLHVAERAAQQPLNWHSQTYGAEMELVHDQRSSRGRTRGSRAVPPAPEQRVVDQEWQALPLTAGRKSTPSG